MKYSLSLHGHWKLQHLNVLGFGSVLDSTTTYTNSQINYDLRAVPADLVFDVVQCLLAPFCQKSKCCGGLCGGNEAEFDIVWSTFSIMVKYEC